MCFSTRVSAEIGKRGALPISENQNKKIRRGKTMAKEIQFMRAGQYKAGGLRI